MADEDDVGWDLSITTTVTIAVDHTPTAEDGGPATRDGAAGKDRSEHAEHAAEQAQHAAEQAAQQAAQHAAEHAGRGRH